MRYDLSHYELQLLPNKPRGAALDDRRVLNGIFWALRPGAPWRDLPDSFVPIPPATIGSFAGEGLASGIKSWMR